MGLPKGGDPQGNGDSVVLSERESRLQGEGSQVSQLTIRGGMHNAGNRNLTVNYPTAWGQRLVLCSTCHHRLHAGQFDDNFGMRC
jgi:hypothetical protein